MFNRFSKAKQGELLIFSQAALWGLFPIITVFSYNSLPTLYSLVGSTFFAAIFFGVMLLIKGNWRDLAKVDAFRDILLSTLIIGIGYYLLTFFALKYTSPGNVSLVSLAEVFFSYVFFHLWKKEDLAIEHLIGCILMVAGVVIVLIPSAHAFNLGDALVLIGTVLTPVGNYFMRRARLSTSSEVIMFIRSSVVAVAVGGVALAVHGVPSAIAWKTSLPFLIVNGLLLMGFSKILWIEGIHRISVMKANALSSIAPLFTLLFVWWFMKTPPSPWQLLAFVPMFFGILLLNKDGHKKPLVTQN